MPNEIQGPDRLSVNVLGIGTMGSQIAGLLAILGFRVTAWNRDALPERIKKCVKARRRLGRKLTDQGGDIHCVDDLRALPQALTIEALEENLQTKRKVIKQLPYDPGEKGLLSNTSSYLPSEIHPAAGGLHFFNPIQILRLVEYLPPANPDPGIDAILQRLTDNDFTLVQVKENRGYIGNFLLFSEIASTLKLVDEFGYTTHSIDQVRHCMGREVSIFSIIDLIGIDTTKRILDNLHETDSGIYVSPMLEKALRKGIYGRKNGTSILEVING